MGKRRFVVEFRGELELELDDAVVDAVDDEWRKTLYANLLTPQDIAEHIAFNFVMNQATLSQLDGWADQPDKNARIANMGDVEWNAKEIP